MRQNKNVRKGTHRVVVHGESKHEDNANEVGSDDNCSVVSVIQLVGKEFNCVFALPNKHFSMYVSMKPVKEWTRVKCFLFLFF